MEEQMTRGDARVQRLLRLALLFDYTSKPLSKDEIFSVIYPDREPAAAERALGRDREELKQAGVTIVYDEANHNYYRATDANKVPAISLTPEMTAALGVALRTMAQEQSFPLPLALNLALQKLGRHIQDDTDEFILGSAMTYDDDVEQQHQRLEQIIDALKRHLRVSFSYTDAKGATTRRTASPLGLNQFKGQWYLLASDDAAAGETRTFSIANIEELTLLDEIFTFPENFSIADQCLPPHLWGPNPLKNVSISIPATRAGRAAFITAHQGTLTQREDGSLLWETSYRDLDRLCELVVAEGLAFTHESHEERTYFVREFLGRVVNAHGE